jgi:hypothetical protein
MKTPIEKASAVRSGGIVDREQTAKGSTEHPC